MKEDLKNISKKTIAYVTSLDMVIKAQELARIKGKQLGESFEPELREIMRANPNEIEAIESTNKIDKILNKSKNILDLRENKNEIL